MAQKKTDTAAVRRVQKFYRILDVNFNRALEGCRVVEDTLRIGNSDRRYRKLKEIRHRLSEIRNSVGLKRLVSSRSVKSDPGAFLKDSLESDYDSSYGIIVANLQRLKESLRVIEEVGRVAFQKKDLFSCAKKLRFETYVVEEMVLMGDIKR